MLLFLFLLSPSSWQMMTLANDNRPRSKYQGSQVQFYVVIVMVDLPSNVKRQADKSYTWNVTGLLVLAHFLVPSPREHTSHRLLVKHFTNDEISSSCTALEHHDVVV